LPVGVLVTAFDTLVLLGLQRSRRWSTGPEMGQRALRFATLDTVIALALAFLVNASILVLAAGSFYGLHGAPVTDLSEAHRLLSPLLGTTAAGLLFGIALLAAGQSSTLTATLAGQIVMEGFLEIRLPQGKRRLLTRSLALVPAMLTVLLLAWITAAAIVVINSALLLSLAAS
jgi:manganese transport protein